MEGGSGCGGGVGVRMIFSFVVSDCNTHLPISELNEAGIGSLFPNDAEYRIVFV